MTVTLGLNFNGQTVGTYAGETTQVTNTATIPLTEFDLPDVEDQGATSYSANIGFTADAINVPFSVYIDNIRLEKISDPDLLTLEINRSNGAATLKNLSPNPISWDYMEIKSTGWIARSGRMEQPRRSERRRCGNLDRSRRIVSPRPWSKPRSWVVTRWLPARPCRSAISTTIR